MHAAFHTSRWQLDLKGRSKQLGMTIRPKGPPNPSSAMPLTDRMCCSKSAQFAGPRHAYILHTDLAPRKAALAIRRAEGSRHAGIFEGTRDAQTFGQIGGGVDDQFSLAPLLWLCGSPELFQQKDLMEHPEMRAFVSSARQDPAAKLHFFPRIASSDLVAILETTSLIKCRK
jgi:hypothetical protein